MRRRSRNGRRRQRGHMAPTRVGIRGPGARLFVGRSRAPTINPRSSFVRRKITRAAIRGCAAVTRHRSLGVFVISTLHGATPQHTWSIVSIRLDTAILSSVASEAPYARLEVRAPPVLSTPWTVMPTTMGSAWKHNDAASDDIYLRRRKRVTMGFNRPSLVIVHAHADRSCSPCSFVRFVRSP